MSAKQQAIMDIQKELSEHGKCFLAFHKQLNPIMNRLVKEHIKAQQHVKV